MANEPDNSEGSPRRGYGAGGTLVPVPDPTVLTTAQLDRAVQFLEGNIRALETRFMDRFAALDREREILRLEFTRVPTMVIEQVEHLKDYLTEAIAKHSDVTDEKFASVNRQFIERDVRTEQAAIATKIAVDAALQAQKEAAGAQNESNAAAITKSEAATVKQIDGIMALLNSNMTATNDKIADLKGRLDRGEGGTATTDRAIDVAQGAHQNQAMNNSNVIAFFAAGIATIAMIGFIISLFVHGAPSIQPTVQYVPAPTAIPTPAPVTVPR
jgi:hypothetical protein